MNTVINGILFELQSIEEIFIDATDRRLTVDEFERVQLLLSLAIRDAKQLQLHKEVVEVKDIAA